VVRIIIIKVQNANRKLLLVKRNLRNHLAVFWCVSLSCVCVSLCAKVIVRHSERTFSVSQFYYDSSIQLPAAAFYLCATLASMYYKYYYVCVCTFHIDACVSTTASICVECVYMTPHMCLHVRLFHVHQLCLMRFLLAASFTRASSTGTGTTVRFREILGTGISEAKKRVHIFPFSTQGGKQASSCFRQRNWVQAREAQIPFPVG